MRCPYCNYMKTKPKDDDPLSYTCPRCKYEFEVTPMEKILDRLFSIPFSSVLFALVVLGIDFFVAWISTLNAKDSLMPTCIGIIVFSSLLLLIFYFSITRRKRGILLIVPKEPFKQRLFNISPILKTVLYLIIVAIGLSSQL
ncbi:MAG: hypothetical protein ACTSYD_09920 [Candidatus Heimdallarchaeaceae archaeon]